jgi:hypothetical protein
MSARIPTFITRDDVEYITFPPPRPVFRAMKHANAKSLIETGELHLGLIDIYLQYEARTLGKRDPNEGTAIVLIDGAPCKAWGLLHKYVLCTSGDRVDQDRLLQLDENYDTIIRISDSHEFAVRILEATKALASNYQVECGPVAYNKGRVSVARQEFEANTAYWYTFQKDDCFAWQNEVRFAVTDLGHQCLHNEEKRLVLTLGSCSKLVQIVR